MKRIFSFCFLLFVFALPVFSIQDEGKIDSLNNLVASTTNNSVKINSLLEIALYYSDKDYNLTSKYISQAILFSQENNYQDGIKKSYLAMSEICIKQNNTDVAIEYLNKTLSLIENKDDNLEENIEIYKKLADIYESKKDYKTSSIYYKLQLQLKDSQNTINNNTDINKLSISTSLNNFNNNISIEQKQVDEKNLWKRISIIGAIVSFIIGLLIFNGYNQKRLSNKILEKQNVAINKQKQFLVKQAEELEKLSIVAQETENSVLIMDPTGTFEWANNGFSRIYGYNFDDFTQKFGKSIYEVSTNQNVKTAVDICRNNKQTVVYESFIFNKINEKTWLQTTLTPIINDKTEITKLIAIETDISKLKNAEEEIASQRDMLKIQNQQITDSIEYARTIQNAILPDLNFIRNFFPVFVIYKAKDIVSGDFYWFSNITNNGINFSFFAVVDCTGHGVPGAFMSMIGNRLLNEIINEKKILQPGNILEEMDKGIIKALQQKHTLIDDGMDISLCRIEKQGENAEVVFSGAKRPIHYYSKSNENIELLQGNKRSIGGICSLRGELEFEENALNLNKGDVVYMYTDGFNDQNSPDRKRFGRKRFNDAISEAAGKTIEEQKNHLENTLQHWQNNAKQRDDITVLGIQI